jgi:drug/metabolite transporter (DMT)-like permease
MNAKRDDPPVIEDGVVMKGRLLPIVLLTCTMLFWSANSVISRAGSFHVPTTGLAFWGWTMAFILFAPWALPRVVRQWRTIREHWPVIMVLGVLGIGLFPQILYGALGTTESINVALVNTATPAAIVALSWLCFRSPVTWRLLIGMAASFIGVIIVIARGSLDVILALQFAVGDIVMLVGIWVWAVYSILLRYRPPEIDSLALLWVMIVPALMVSGLIYFSELIYPWRFDPVAQNLVFIAYAGIFPTALAYVFYNIGARALGPQVASQFLFMLPIITAILAVIFLGETFESFHLISLLLVLGGLYFANANSTGESS